MPSSTRNSSSANAQLKARKLSATTDVRAAARLHGTLAQLQSRSPAEAFANLSLSYRLPVLSPVKERAPTFKKHPEAGQAGQAGLLPTARKTSTLQLFSGHRASDRHNPRSRCAASHSRAATLSHR